MTQPFARVGRTALVAFSETDEYRLGEIGVFRVKRFLQAKGAFVFSTCDLSGRFAEHPPAMEGPEGQRLILPDLDVSMAGQARVWAEVKTKSQASWTRTTRRDEHGIGLRHWVAYRRIQEKTGNQVFLYIYQRDESVLLGSAIDDLANDDLRPSRIDDERMVFFPSDAFRLKADLPVDIEEPAIFAVQLKLKFELRTRGAEAWPATTTI
jgi:hypothetical protein